MNNDMKKFLRKLILLPFTVILVFALYFSFGAFVVGNQHIELYETGLVKKVARLESINEPKIILAGSSSVAFGTNSPMIEAAFNMPVVNLGFQAGAGNAFNEDIAKLNINSGDIIILSHHDYADNDRIESTYILWDALEYNWELYKILRIKDYFDMFRGYPAYWWRSFIFWITETGNRVPPSVYTSRGFNEFGDMAIKPEEYRLTVEKMFKPGNVKFPRINDTCINRINEYNKYIKNKGATLLIAGYPIAYGEFTQPADVYDKFQHELASKLDCEIISDFRDYFIPYKYFYNGDLHLDNEGAKIRTAQLIKDLQRWQNKTGNR
ncbi:MAG: hypothetical protein IJT21_02505 [Synergistaceae bacterium]|nr:hypothetical protein [Synergistaceae bacterium]